jgi:hypothetical protein
MGTWYTLVNQTRREMIGFGHIPANKKKELAGNPVAAAIIAWYLLEHAGDRIAFFGDDGEWPFGAGSPDDLTTFAEVTDRTVEQLVATGILRDDGRDELDDDDPDVYMRKLRNIWMGDDEG